MSKTPSVRTEPKILGQQLTLTPTPELCMKDKVCQNSVWRLVICFRFIYGYIYRFVLKIILAVREGMVKSHLLLFAVLIASAIPTNPSNYIPKAQMETPTALTAFMVRSLGEIFLKFHLW